MESLAEWLGISLDEDQHRQLEAYGRWLATEAVAAGGIGPREVERLFDRHVGDALTYRMGLDGDVGTVVDVGSGAGLPGIPLAIACPDLVVTLLDRSGRRIDLARRAIRILRIDNVVTVLADVETVTDRFGAAVFRASLPPTQALEALPAITPSGGTGVLGLSRRAERPPVPPAPDAVVVDVLHDAPPMLDSPVWLLRMQRSAE